MQSMLLRLNYRLFVRVFTLVLCAIELLMAVICLLGKNKTRVLLYSGIFLMAAGFTLYGSGIQNLLLPLSRQPRAFISAPIIFTYTAMGL